MVAATAEMTDEADAPVFALKSLMPWLHIQQVRPCNTSTSFDIRRAAEDPPRWGGSHGYGRGPQIELPPIPQFITYVNLFRDLSLMNRPRISGHLSHPFIVEFVPSVMESPRTARTLLDAVLQASTPHKKNHEVQECWKKTSPAA